jgi:hypothetical protein
LLLLLVLVLLLQNDHAGRPDALVARCGGVTAHLAVAQQLQRAELLRQPAAAARCQAGVVKQGQPQVFLTGQLAQPALVCKLPQVCQPGAGGGARGAAACPDKEGCVGVCCAAALFEFVCETGMVEEIKSSNHRDVPVLRNSPQQSEAQAGGGSEASKTAAGAAA